MSPNANSHVGSTQSTAKCWKCCSLELDNGKNSNPINCIPFVCTSVRSDSLSVQYDKIVCGHAFPFQTSPFSQSHGRSPNFPNRNSRHAFALPTELFNTIVIQAHVKRQSNRMPKTKQLYHNLSHLIFRIVDDGWWVWLWCEPRTCMRTVEWDAI